MIENETLIFFLYSYRYIKSIAAQRYFFKYR